ncbi:MAG: peptide chain release factor N(5)-glutamine methyltransferase [Bacteroidota bacterium]
MSAGADLRTEVQSSAWTVLSLLRWAERYLTERGFDEARLHVELLLAHVLDVGRLQLYLQFDRPLTAEELAQFKELFLRRTRHEPLQYILGETLFMGLPISVDRRVLIPRPETELLVEAVINAEKGWGDARNIEILDVGTGSGNVAIALARFLPTAAVTSIDRDRDALAVAESNAQRNHVPGIRFIECDLLSGQLPAGDFDVIVSNPPYVSEEEFASLQPEIREFEPRYAVTDGGDGLRFIRRIAALASEKLLPGGRVFLEIGYNQREAVTRILAEAGLESVAVRDDFAGNPRIASGRRSGAAT